MAAAHILEDLPNAIYDCYPVEKAEFDEVFEHIVTCVEISRRLYHLSSRAWVDVLQQFKGSLPLPIRRDALTKIIFALGIAVAWLPPVLNPGVKQMREMAWRIALAKVELSK